MKYKLKDFVTDEMLVECGFIVEGKYARFATKKESNFDSLIIPLNDECLLDNVRYVRFNNMRRDESGDDITPYIQDLIEKGYVEVVE